MSEGRWALWAGLRSTWERARADWRRLPPGAAGRWMWAMLVGSLATAGLVLALTQLVRVFAERGLQAWDRDLLLRLVEGPLLSYHDAMWWEAFGASSMLIPLAATGAVLAFRGGRPLLGLTIALSWILAKPLILVGWGTWDRARPEVVAAGVATPPLHSFPSGHALQTAAIYGLLVYLWARRSRSWVERLLAVLLWAALVTLVGLARLRLGTHWPSDVLGGTLAGLGWLATMVVALRRAEAAGGR